MRACAGVLVAMLLLAGCGASHAAGASIPRSRTFIDAVAALPGDLDVSATPGPAAAAIVPSWSSELVRPRGVAPGPNAQLPPADAVVPYLATSWRIAPDGDATFQLRHGVRGPTGDPFTAADVAWSIDRDLAISPAAPYLFSLAHIERANPVTVLGAYAVRINVTAPSPFLLGVLSWYGAGIYDRQLLRAHATPSDPWAEQWGETNSATFAAYYVALFQQSQQIVLLANPYSWVHPYYRKVEIEQMSDSGDRLNAVLAGTVDHTSGLAWDDFTSATQFGWASHVHAGILQNGPAVESWLLNVTQGPLRKPAVRAAISLAVDRADLAGQTWGGYATPDVLALPRAYGQVQPAGYDLAAARALLAAAGYRHGFTLKVSVPFDLGDGNQGEELYLLTHQLALIGITLEPQVGYDDDQTLALAASHQLTSLIEDIAPSIGGAPFALLTDYSTTLDPASPAAAFGFDDPALEALLRKLATTPASTPATGLLTRIVALVDANSPWINLFELPTQNVTRSDIAGYAAYAVPVTYYEYLHPVR